MKYKKVNGKQIFFNSKLSLKISTKSLINYKAYSYYKFSNNA